MNKGNIFISIGLVLAVLFGASACGGGGGESESAGPVSLLAFEANDELYLYDGVNSPYAVTTSNTTGSGSSIRDLAVLDELLLFQGTDDAGDRELWSYHPVQGASRVADLNTSGSSSPRYITTIGGAVYFQADDGARGSELWVTNGTGAGTTLVSDINNTGSSNPRDITGFHGRVYFKADPTGTGDNYLFAYNGAGAAYMVTTSSYSGGIEDPSTPVAIDSLDLLVFRGYDPISGTQIMAFDGTEVTLLVVNTDNGDETDNAFAKYFTDYGGKIFFQATESIHGPELWVSDGTASGTTLYADILPDADGGSPSELTVFGGSLYFSAREELNNTQIYSFAGTSAPAMLLEINTSDSSFPKEFTEYGDLLHFQANDGVRGAELWATDGTAAGTTLVADLTGDPTSSSPQDLVVVTFKP